jgi:phage gp37-like protein
MNYSFTDYENAVLFALGDLTRENGGYLAALEGYAGQLDSPQALKLWLGRVPAVAVAVTGAEYPAGGRSNLFWRQDVQFYIFVGAQSWRGQDEARKGAVGAHLILADIRRRLLGQTLGLEIRECSLVREYVLASDLNSVIFAAEYQIINDRITEE